MEVFYFRPVSGLNESLSSTLVSQPKNRLREFFRTGKN
jgi:hypothetical protein